LEFNLGDPDEVDLRVGPALLDLHGGLAVHAGRATEGRAHVTYRAPLNPPALPGLPPKEERGGAGEQAAEEAAEQAGLAQVLRVLVD